ncbi:MAG TPA: adenylate/guanylate cyclase domain-containing protein [Burkholderiaceae bacterium]|nr:adenylate/guanylate cyclase domain-containing protein [Burkholderiaceae bacterium]
MSDDPTIRQRSVLFADLRGSTSLYESLGNAAATTVVTRNVDELARIVRAHRGVVVKTLGDGLMAVFPEPVPAVRASEQMHDAQVRLAAAAGRRAALKLQIGIAHGEVVEVGNDCFGDAVNVAARLLDHAGDNETLVTSTVVEALSEYERFRYRSLDRMQLRGRAEPVHLYLLDPRRGGDMATTSFGGLAPLAEPEGIRLSWLDLRRTFRTADLPVVLGRSPQATYCIDDRRVSRSHARIDWHGGTFQLTDLSYNGTFVRFGGSGEVVALRRSTCTLHGQGVIGLGAPPTDALAPSVEFAVVTLGGAA